MEQDKPLIDLSKLTVEQALYGLALLLALIVRLLGLGQSPLTESEATWANQALALSRGEPSAIDPQPLYVLFTTLVFGVMKASEGWARLLPALCGSLLVLLPPLFSRWAGAASWARRAGIVLAFGLALDPALVALSRQAGSSLPALSLLLLAVGLGASRRWKLAGIAAGLALLSGPGFWQGLLGLALAWGAASLLVPQRKAVTGEPEPAALPVGTVLLFAAGTVVLAGTLFLRFPQGLGAMAGSLPAYLESWAPGTRDLLAAPALRLPLALLVTQPLVVLFAIPGIWRVWLNRQPDALGSLGQKLSLWAALALLLAMLNPNRQVSDVTWALIPLWAIAALELASLVPEEPERDYLPIIGLHTALTVLFTVLFFYNLLRLHTLGAEAWLYFGVLAGIALIILVVTLIIGAGWSFNVTRLGVSWGIALVLGISMLSSLRYSGFTGPSQSGDLWGTPPGTGQARELSETLGDLSEWRTGQRTEIDILAAVDSAALNWELRNFPNLQLVQGLSPDMVPSVIITSQEQTELNLTLAYRGQDFVWEQYPGWGGLLPVQWVDWLYFHKAPAVSQSLILWAHNDLFPGGVLSKNDPPEAQTYPSDELPISP
ncbi:MAG: hypothetical protein MUC85_03740 [Anaerolineales bacterium]|jgi:hypothetical protein|nr:hypothetical protein [Anaerolineales bacterium]